jgi:hypothetical protein
MATQDNQISDKRRRLFKALSAAPVVATLRPGQALANSSAFQCLSNPPALDDVDQPVYLYDEMPADCTGAPGKDCLAFVARTYWSFEDLKTEANQDFWKEEVGESNIIVRTNDVTRTGKLYVVEMTSGSYKGYRLKKNKLGFTASGNTLYVPGKDSAQPEALTGKSGHFLLTVSPNPDNTGIEAAHVYPQEPQDPLAHSCGTSMGVEATDGFRWIQG